MTAKKNLIVLLLCTSVVGCVQYPVYDVPTPVGPQPLLLAPPILGELQVYSEWVYVNGDDLSTQYHSSYEVRTEDGAFLRTVSNGDKSNPGPEPVLLPPGRYLVIASAPGYRRLTVPVLIDDSRNTILHLDDSEPPGSARGAPSDLVRLPNGKAIGWRASYDINGAAAKD